MSATLVQHSHLFSEKTRYVCIVHTYMQENIHMHTVRIHESSRNEELTNHVMIKNGNGFYFGGKLNKNKKIQLQL